MKRSDIIRTIQVQFKHMRGSDATAILDSVSDQLMGTVATGDHVEIRGFGTFQSRARSAKVGYNPRSAAPMQIPAGKTILFKPSRELTKKMNG